MIGTDVIHSLSLRVLYFACMLSQCKAHAAQTSIDMTISNFKMGILPTSVLMSVHGRDVGCFTQNVKPKCGILSSKLRSPVFKGRRRRRRRWGCGSVRAVSV